MGVAHSHGTSGKFPGLHPTSPGSRDVRLKASRSMPRPVMQSPGPVLKDQSCRCFNLSSSAKVFSKSSSFLGHDFLQEIYSY